MSNEAAKEVLVALAKVKMVSPEALEEKGWDPDDFISSGLAMGLIEVVGVRAGPDGVLQTFYRRVG